MGACQGSTAHVKNKQTFLVRDSIARESDVQVIKVQETVNIEHHDSHTPQAPELSPKKTPKKTAKKLHRLVSPPITSRKEVEFSEMPTFDSIITKVVKKQKLKKLEWSFQQYQITGQVNQYRPCVDIQ